MFYFNKGHRNRQPSLGLCKVRSDNTDSGRTVVRIFTRLNKKYRISGNISLLYPESFESANCHRINFYARFLYDSFYKGKNSYKYSETIILALRISWRSRQFWILKIGLWGHALMTSRLVGFRGWETVNDFVTILLKHYDMEGEGIKNCSTIWLPLNLYKKSQT